MSDPPPVLAGSGPVQLVGWAAFDAGPANEVDQSAQWIVSDVTNAVLYAALPQVLGDADGSLQYQPAAGVFGTSTFTLSVRDSGGTANGGVDLSAPQTVTVTIMGTEPPIFCDGFEDGGCP